MSRVHFNLAAFSDGHDQCHCLLFDACHLHLLGGRQSNDRKALHQANNGVCRFGEGKIHLRNVSALRPFVQEISVNQEEALTSQADPWSAIEGQITPFSIRRIAI